METLCQISRPQPGDEFNVFYADVNSPYPTSPRTIETGNVKLVRYLDNEGISRFTIEAKAIAWQSYLFNENIVGLLGYREDDTQSFAKATLNELQEMGLDITDRQEDGSYDTNFVRLSTTPSLVESGDTTTWSVIGRYPENWLGDLS